MALYLLRDFDSLRPSHLFNKYLELDNSPEDWLTPFTIPSHRLLRCPIFHHQRNVVRPDSRSVVKCDKDQFQVNLDVQQFTPEEIQVKVVDKCIVVEGKHEEKQDEHGFISRQFVRRYVIPEGHDIKGVSSALSSDGILTITAPKLTVDEKKEVVIPITYTGPVKSSNETEEEKKEEKKKEK